MANIDVTISVDEVTYKVGQGLGNFVVDMVGPLKDGFQFADLSSIVGAVTLDLVPVLDKFKQLPAELKDDPASFMAAWVASGLAAYKKLKA